VTESFDLLLMDYELDNGKGDVLLKELQIARKPIPAPLAPSSDGGVDQNEESSCHFFLLRLGTK